MIIFNNKPNNPVKEYVIFIDEFSSNICIGIWLHFDNLIVFKNEIEVQYNAIV